MIQAMYAVKVELKVNNKEQTLLRKHAGFARFVYNYGLALMQGLERDGIAGGYGKKIKAIKKVLTNYTKKQQEFRWMSKLSSKVYQSSLQALESAYNRWGQGISDRPRFKRRKDGESFTVYDGNGKVLLRSGKQIKIPTLGIFRLKEALPCSYCTQTFTISYCAGKWFVSFAVDAEKIPPTYHPEEKVGIDLGVKCFATLSDGTSVESPKPMKKAKIKLAKLQWRNRKKQLGNRRLGVKQSNKAKKYFDSLARQHYAIASQRRDFLHKLTTDISRKYYRIRIEDLNVSGMFANRKLSAAISDLGFYEFRRQLTYKSQVYGTKVELVDTAYCRFMRYSNSSL
ncbi:RNA-guided endonuclease InsQ/TnpB family protein [Brasilonema bromeliae]|uniref:Transposase n=1 Tax=Brasilonema bromeliae SPC951 TaxID=385972 RepID=A0ABX1P439_9CYAN|nr:RNA-guided endonuclease TnpB family protein [Brasilonema bromeliae]NMG19123.1 transposase [Brasilonema bromeliae SPC951]